MEILNHLRSLGYNASRGLCIGYLQTFKATKTVDGIDIRIVISLNKDKIDYIEIDLLKHYREDIIYNKLLKSKCKTLEKLEPTVNNLIDILRKEDAD